MLPKTIEPAGFEPNRKLISTRTNLSKSMHISFCVDIDTTPAAIHGLFSMLTIENSPSCGPHGGLSSLTKRKTNEYFKILSAVHIFPGG